MGGVGGDDDGDDGQVVAAVWAFGDAVGGRNGVGYLAAGANGVGNDVAAVVGVPVGDAAARRAEPAVGVAGGDGDRAAAGHTGDEARMRAELSAAVAGVIAGMNTTPVTITSAETETLLKAADLVTRARTSVVTDYRGDVIDAHAPEMPTRFAKQLTQILRGGVAIGMDRADALRLAIRCARDSMPPLRLAIIDHLKVWTGNTTQEVRKGIDKPRLTVDRQLQALHSLGVLTCSERPYGPEGKIQWCYTLAPDIDPDAIVIPQSCPGKSPTTPDPNKKGRDKKGKSPGVGTDSPGQHSQPGDPSTNGQPTGPPLCTVCHKAELTHPESIARGVCAECASMFRGNPKPNRRTTQ